MGKVRIGGLDPFREKDQFGHRVGVLFAGDGFYQGLSPLGNLEFSCRLYSLPKERANQVIAQSLR